MKKALTALLILGLFASGYIVGVLRTVYTAEISWGTETETTMQITLDGYTWEFSAYNGN